MYNIKTKKRKTTNYVLFKTSNNKNKQILSVYFDFYNKKLKINKKQLKFSNKLLLKAKWGFLLTYRKRYYTTDNSVNLNICKICYH